MIVTLQLNGHEFVLRPMCADDRPAVDAIAEQVWDGHDYLPQVFDGWLADPEGLFCAGVLQGRVVALGKLSRVGDGQWWMEGLRVHPDARGLGIARLMQHYLVHYARRFAPGTLRFSTASENAAIHKLAGETAFEQVAAYRAYGAAADPAAHSPRLVQLSPAHLAAAWQTLAALPYFERSQRTMEDRWRFLPLTRRSLQERLGAGLLYGWTHGPDLAGVMILNEPHAGEREDDETRLYVAYADALPEELPGLALAIRGLAAAQGYDRVSWKVLDDAALLAHLAAAGYEQRWELRVLLFARDLSIPESAGILPEFSQGDLRGNDV